MPAAKAMGAAKKAAVKVDHKGRVFTHVLAQMASAAPPLGKRKDRKSVASQKFGNDHPQKSQKSRFVLGSKDLHMRL